MREALLWCFALALALAGNAAVQAQSAQLLDLETAIGLAVERSPKVVEANRAVKAAQLELEGARGALGTNVTLNATAGLRQTGRFRADGSVRADGNVGPSLSWSAVVTSAPSSGEAGESLSVSYQIWPPATDGRDWTAIHSASRALSMAQRALDVAKAEAAVAALELYRTIQLQSERLRLAEALRDDAKAKLAQVEEAVAAGRASTSDRINQEIKLLEQEEALADRRDQLASAENELAKLLGLEASVLGLPPAQEIAPTTGLAVDRAELPTQEEALARALAVSADVRTRENALADAKQSVAVARRDRGLNLSLNGVLEPAKSGETGWSIALTGSYALSDGGRRTRALQSAELNLERAEDAYEQAVAAISESVDASLRSLRRVERALEVANAMERLRRLDVDVARQQADRGYLSESELRAREHALQTAVLDRIAAELNVQLAHLRFELLMGGAPAVP